MPFGDHPPHHPIISCGDRRVRKLKEIREEMRQRMHAPVREQHRWLCQVLRGHYRYYGVIFNSRALRAFETWRRQALA
jgi:hypothetical protein